MSEIKKTRYEGAGNHSVYKLESLMSEREEEIYQRQLKLQEHQSKVSVLEKQLDILNEEAISRIGIEAKLKVDLESAREVIAVIQRNSEYMMQKGDTNRDREEFGKIEERAREWMKGDGK